MASGSFETTFGALGTWKFRMNWSSTKNTASNTSNVTFSFQTYCPVEDGDGAHSDTRVFYTRNASDTNLPLTLEFYNTNFNKSFTIGKTVLSPSPRYTFNNLSLTYDGTTSTSYTIYNVPHNADGSMTLYFNFYWNIDHVLVGEYVPGESGEDGEVDGNYFSGSHSFPSYKSITLDKIARNPSLTSVTNFTDEENPRITYSNPVGNSASSLKLYLTDTANKTHYITARDIPKTGTSYTLTLTDDERNALRAAAVAADTTTLTVRFAITAVVSGSSLSSARNAVLTIVDCDPVITGISIRDVNSDTVALTGDENTLIKLESMAEYIYYPEARKGATIVSQFVQCGNAKVMDQNVGVIDDVESGTFIFNATDSRNAVVNVTVEKNIIDYIKPTCYQTVVAEMSGETGAVVKLNVKGNYFNGSFGAANNELKIEVRHTQNDGEMGEWFELTDGLIPVFDGNTYTLDVTISGFEYSRAYTFQCRATDKLNNVQSAQYTVRVLPIFDWDNDDFNFNVPVTMNGETVLRHNKDANNIVLSASGGHIYLRPGGTSDTSGEVKINTLGELEVQGDIIINGISLMSLLSSKGWI